MVILNPIVRRFARFKIPRAISVLIVYLFFFAVVVFSFATIIPVLIDQTSNFVSSLPTYVADLHIAPNISNQISNELLVALGDLPTKLIDFGVGLINNIFTLFTILTFAFYLLMSRDKIDKKLATWVGEKRAGQVGEILDELEIKLGGWARGQILLMLTVGVLNYIGFQILGVPYALPLGIFAGLLEIVPYVGPVIGAVPAVLIGFGISPLMGVATLILATLVQQVENYVLAPKIMERSVGVTPVVTLLSLTIGFRVAGIAGVLISIPIVITLQVLARRRFLA
jgi:predicted PurR-regulated permease PerM